MSSPRWLRPVVAVLAVLAPAAALQAYNFFYHSSLDYLGRRFIDDTVPLRWPRFETNLYMDAAALAKGSPLGNEARDSAAAWNQIYLTPFQFHIVDRLSDPTLGDLDGCNDVSLYNFFDHPINQWPGDVGYIPPFLGVSYLTYPAAGNHDLTDCDVLLHDGTALRGNLWDPYSNARFHFDFRSVAMHEFGHVLGLNHSTVSDAVMTPNLSWDVQKSLTTDDRDGVFKLYTDPPAPGPVYEPNDPSGTQMRFGVVDRLDVPGTEVRVGEFLRFTGSVRGPDAGPLELDRLGTVPKTGGPLDGLHVAAGETLAFDLERPVTDLPGVYSKAVHFLGGDSLLMYGASRMLADDRIRVRRPEVRLPVGDRLIASLGPEGDDRILLRLDKGARACLDWSSGADGTRYLLLDPRGRAVRLEAGRPFKVRRSGDHVLAVANPSATPVDYRLYTAGAGAPPAVKARGAWSGAGTVEVPFRAMARTGGTLSLSGPDRLGLRIVGLRDPRGAAVEVVPGRSIAVEAFGADGEWTAIVEGAPGTKGRFTLRADLEWTTGAETSI